VGMRFSPTLGYRTEEIHWTQREEAVQQGKAMIKWVQVDLGASLPIQEIRLLPTHPPNLIHQAGHGFPPRFKLEISDHASFDSASTIVAFENAPMPRPGDNVVSFAGEGRTQGLGGHSFLPGLRSGLPGGRWVMGRHSHRNGAAADM
jgi:hypothetical protein